MPTGRRLFTVGACLFLGLLASCQTPVRRLEVQPRQCMHTLDCADGEFCEKSPGECARAGICAAIPKDVPCPESPLEWQTVCGCDGRTYLDACEVRKAGINIAREGDCVRGVAGPCISDDDCSEGFFCDRFPGDCAGEGICEPVPAACVDESGEVCGCDGNTYPNICAAKGNSVSVAYGGACRSGNR